MFRLTKDQGIPDTLTVSLLPCHLPIWKRKGWVLAMLEIRDFCAWLRSRFAPLRFQLVRRLYRGVRTAPRIRDRETPMRRSKGALWPPYRVLGMGQGQGKSRRLRPAGVETVIFLEADTARHSH